MAERNVTFLILARDFASRVMNNVGDSADRAAKKLDDLNTLGLGPVATAGAALGPALLPVLGGAVVGTAALGSAFAATGAAAVVFGAVTASVFGEVADASAKSEDLRTKISLLNREISMAEGSGVKVSTLVKSRDKALLEYRARLAELPAPTRAAVLALDGLKTAWGDFVDANKPVVLGLMTRGMAALRAVLPSLQPLFNVGAEAARGLLGVFERFVSGGQLDRLVAFLSTRAGPAFEAFGGIVLSLGYGVGQLLAPFDAMTGGVLGGLDRMSLSFARWARESGRAGIERFIAWVSENGSGVGDLFSSLASSLGTLASAAAPLAPISLAIATGLSAVIEAVPQPVLTALIGSWIAWSVALQAAMIVTKVGAAVGVLAGIFAGVTAAVTGATLAENSNTAAKVANRIATVAVTGVQKAFAAAVWLSNTALLASPITWVVLGLVALGVGLYMAWQRSETFRRVVTGAFDAVGNAAGALGRWFSMAWGTIQRWWGMTISFFTALPGRIMGAIIAFPGMYVRFWLNVLNRAAYLVGYAIGATIRFFILLPGRIMSAVRAIPGLLSALWSAVWSRTKSTVSSGVNATVGFFAALPGRAQRAVSSLWGRISGAFVSAKNAAVAKGRELVTGTISWVSQLPGRAASALRGVPGRVKGAFAGAGGWLIQAGRDILSGLVRGITGAAGWVVQEAKRVASSIVGGIKAGLGIGSPSRVMRDEVGRWIPPGIAIGLRSAMPGLLGEVGSSMAAVTDAASVRARSSFDLSSGAAARGQSMPAGLGGGGGNVVILNVNGALDPNAVGQQIVTLLLRWAASQGKTLEIVK